MIQRLSSCSKYLYVFSFCAGWAVLRPRRPAGKRLFVGKLKPHERLCKNKAHRAKKGVTPEGAVHVNKLGFLVVCNSVTKRAAEIRHTKVDENSRIRQL